MRDDYTNRKAGVCDLAPAESWRNDLLGSPVVRADGARSLRAPSVLPGEMHVLRVRGLDGPEARGPVRGRDPVGDRRATAAGVGGRYDLLGRRDSLAHSARLAAPYRRGAARAHRPRP